jgi:hypothetical protein
MRVGKLVISRFYNVFAVTPLVEGLFRRMNLRREAHALPNSQMLPDLEALVAPSASVN